VGNVWEMFGKCLELSFTDYQVVNMVLWEMFGNCLGIWWGFGGNLRGDGKKKKDDKKKSNP